MTQGWAEKLEEARASARPVTPFTDSHSDFTLDQAYGVQEEGRRLREAAGEVVSGYKMGLTSLAKQRDVGVDSPIQGYLLASMERDKGAVFSMEGRIHPRVEPEVAVVLGATLEGPDVTLQDVMHSLDRVVPALEILDSRFEKFRFKLPDVVADNTSACGYVLGTEPLDPERVNLLGITVRKNGNVVTTGAAAAILGNPFLAVVSLVHALADQGRALEAGQVVLTGGITASVPFTAGDWLAASWPEETLSFVAK